MLARLSGSLCDAVTGPGATARRCSRRSTAENLFLVPLDDQRRWYRYHHLFADMLRARLLASSPERGAELHRRASAWLERGRRAPTAIHHALAGGDVDRAADLVELGHPGAGRERREARAAPLDGGAPR